MHSAKRKTQNHVHTIVLHLISEQFGYVIPLSNYFSLYNFNKLEIEPNLLNLHDYLGNTNSITLDIEIET